jgi:hypothetical protein
MLRFQFFQLFFRKLIAVAKNVPGLMQKIRVAC